jgi:hypothetical protein
MRTRSERQEALRSFDEGRGHFLTHKPSIEELKNTEMYDTIKEALTLLYTWLAFPFL